MVAHGVADYEAQEEALEAHWEAESQEDYEPHIPDECMCSECMCGRADWVWERWECPDQFH